MRTFDTIQQAIDNSLNVVTHKAVVQEVHNLSQEGIQVIDQDHIQALAMDIRKDVQRMLEQSN